MRLPVIDKDQARIDEYEAIRMIRYAFDQGVNYIDTAWPYHGGNSEGVVGRALKDGYRKEVRLATKLPSRLVRNADDLDRFLNEQLRRLETDHIDFYLFHGLDRQSWPLLRDLDVLEWAEKANEAGKFSHLGFSFHDEYEVFKEIVDAYDGWALCQIQYNFMDIEQQAGTKGLKYAAEKGLAVVVMEPIRGGQLLRNPPDSVTRLWESVPTQRPPAEWALQWVWNHEEVSTVLSGMSTMKHVKENVASADRSGPNLLTGDELSLIDRVREEFQKQSAIPCTNCKYCLPCPNNVNIPGILNIYNEAMIYSDVNRAKTLYKVRLMDGERADQCTQCRECEELCPQKIAIPDWLIKTKELLEPGS
jgi:predicted aldo/keto reductase-like oxidoreductase